MDQSGRGRGKKSINNTGRLKCHLAQKKTTETCAPVKRERGCTDVIFRWKHFARLDLIQLLSHLARVCVCAGCTPLTRRPRQNLGFTLASCRQKSVPSIQQTRSLMSLEVSWCISFCAVDAVATGKKNRFNPPKNVVRVNRQKITAFRKLTKPS